MILKTGKAEKRASGFTLFRPSGAALLRVRGLRFAS